MKIGKNWEIKSDSMNVTLLKKVTIRATPKKPKHDIWKIEGYYSTIKGALTGLVDAEVRSTALKDLETISKKQDELYKLIEGLKV